MPSARKKTTASGRVFYEISVSRGRGRSRLTCRWYAPEGWSQKAIEKELAKQAAEFERKAHAGEILSRAEQRKKAAREAEEQRRREAAEAAELAKLKTVQQYADEVFMPTKETTISENTREGYQMFLDRYIVPVLGDVRLVDVSPAMLSKLLLAFQKSGKAHSTAVRLYNILNGIFEMAFLDDSIPLNPMLKVKRPAPRKDEVPKEPAEMALTVEQLRHVLACVELEPLKWQAYITLSADTGARRGELCGLQWRDIEWTSGTITIRRNLQYTATKGVYVTTPKTGRTRSVDIGPDTLDLLRRLRAEQAGTCMSKWCFSQDGTPDPLFPQSPTRYFQIFGKRYDVPGFHPHMLRHTFASIALTHGAELVSVSARLGHADSSTTLRMYAHASEESIRRAGQQFRDALKMEQTKTGQG